MSKTKIKPSGTEERVRIERLAEQVFGDEALASCWMNKSCRELRGFAPRSVLSEPERIRTVEELLHRIDAGFVA